MITNNDARDLIANRITMFRNKGTVYLGGQWKLYELEALCIVLRDRIGVTAEGAEEHLVRTKGYQSRMPMARLQFIVRSYFNQFKAAISNTVKEDIGQLTNPGSQLVYGTLLTEKSVLYTDEAMRTLISEEEALVVNQMTNELQSLKCSQPTQKIAIAMLLSMIWVQDQEDALPESLNN